MSRKVDAERTQVEPVEAEFERKRGVTAVEVEEGLVHISVTLPQTLAQRLGVFRALAGAGISVFLIKFHPDGIHFVLRDSFVEKAEKVLNGLGLPYVMTPNCATVSVLSSAMRDLPGVMAAIAQAVYEEGVDLLETGDSHDAVTLLVKQKDAQRVATALKKKFGL
ncbi:MAG: ACT domain-containing protein [Armatimonadetes bacterium]|nr:ACT domain-containing protein [Armatimonadota bacterium]MDW8122911.1 ACT domain-containing protein [Armatimonadota bacterium]